MSTTYSLQDISYWEVIKKYGLLPDNIQIGETYLAIERDSTLTYLGKCKDKDFTPGQYYNDGVSSLYFTFENYYPSLKRICGSDLYSKKINVVKTLDTTTQPNTLDEYIQIRSQNDK